MPLHHAAPAPSFSAVLPQAAPAAPAAGGPGFAAALRQAGGAKLPEAAAPRFTPPAANAAAGLQSVPVPIKDGQAKSEPAASPARPTKHAAIAASSGATPGWIAPQPVLLPAVVPVQSAPAAGVTVQARPTPAGEADSDEPGGEAATLAALPAQPPQVAAPDQIAAANVLQETAAAPVLDADLAGLQAQAHQAASGTQTAPRLARASGARPDGAQFIVETQPAGTSTPAAPLATQIHAAHAAMQADLAADAGGQDVEASPASETAGQPQGGQATTPVPADDAGGAPAPASSPAESGPGAAAKHDANAVQPRQDKAEKTVAPPDGTALQPAAASAATNAPAIAQAATGAVQAAGAATPTPTAQAPAPGGTAPPPAPAAPAAQVAQGLSALHMTGAGARQVTIHLTPGTLGAVQVRIERGTDGAPTVTMLAEKAETLHALQQDSAHLHEALDRAGLPSAGRQVSYELAQGQASGQPATGGGGGPGFGAGQGGPGSQHGQHGQRGGQAAQPQTPGYARAGPDVPGRTTAPPPRTRATAASGINITA